MTGTSKGFLTSDPFVYHIFLGVSSFFASLLPRVPEISFLFLQSAASASQPSTMSEFLIQDEDLAGLKGKVVVLTGKSIPPLCGVMFIL